MELDCTNYLNDNCPKGKSFNKPKIESDNLNFLMVGCWGVYCWDGLIKMEEYNQPKEGKEYKPETSTKNYGSGRVVKGLVKYSEENKTQAVFLAGDNVYDDDVLKPALKQMIEEKKFPTKKQYNSNHNISGQNIDKQLQEGFLKCVNKVKVSDFYLAIGNHDIKSCYDLNQQLLFSTNDANKYRLPALYYNVVYEYNNNKINFIIIDTNIFEDEPKNCKGKTYDLEIKLQLINLQIKWVVDCLKSNDCDWNIIIGHIPYKCNPHKPGKLDYNLNKQLDYLFHQIKMAKCPPVQTYFCADEHNQQFLYDNDNGLALVVAGTGGTALDKILIEGQYYTGTSVKTHYYSNQFGFVSFTFENDLTIKYFTSTPEESKSQFFVKLDKDGGIIEKQYT